MLGTTVWKYSLETRDVQDVEMPKNANIIHCAEQNNVICLWAEVEPDAPKITKTFYIVGTGWDHRPECLLRHVGSVVESHRPLVWHIYEKVVQTIPYY